MLIVILKIEKSVFCLCSSLYTGIYYPKTKKYVFKVLILNIGTNNIKFCKNLPKNINRIPKILKNSTLYRCKTFTFLKMEGEIGTAEHPANPKSSHFTILYTQSAAKPRKKEFTANPFTVCISTNTDRV